MQKQKRLVANINTKHMQSISSYCIFGLHNTTGNRSKTIGAVISHASYVIMNDFFGTEPLDCIIFFGVHVVQTHLSVGHPIIITRLIKEM